MHSTTITHIKSTEMNPSPIPTQPTILKLHNSNQPLQPSKSQQRSFFTYTTLTLLNHLHTPHTTYPHHPNNQSRLQPPLTNCSPHPLPVNNKSSYLQQTPHSSTTTLEFALFNNSVSIYPSHSTFSPTSRFRFSMSLFRASMIHR